MPLEEYSSIIGVAGITFGFSLSVVRAETFIRTVLSLQFWSMYFCEQLNLLIVETKVGARWAARRETYFPNDPCC